MKSLALAVLYLLLTFIGNTAQAPAPPCPVKGDGKTLKGQHSDSLKNRFMPSPKINKKITLSSMLRPGNDAARFSEKDFAEISGYVFDVKYGGPETCNCRSKDKSQLDIHIEIVRTLKNTSDTCIIIAEINRFTRAKDKTLTYEYVRSLEGKKVILSGYLFFDDEHKQNAYNTNPTGNLVWRRTSWEIHPVISIKELK